MKYAAVLAALVICFTTFSNAQSGRRATKPAAPPPAAQPRDDGEYSESKPSGGPVYSRRAMAKEAARVVQPKDDTKVSSDEDTIKVETNLVTIPVSVYEKGGAYVGGLRRTDFKIFEDGTEQELAYFGTLEVPFSVIVLIDTSGSTDTKIKTIQNAAMDFVNKLKPNDRVMVMQFSSDVDTLCDFTSDRGIIEKAIRRIGGGGATALYRAVETALKKKFDKVEGRKAIVLFTDGVDTMFGGSGYEKTLALAEESEAVIYPVYYNTYLAMKGIGTGGVMSTPPTIGIPQSQGGPSAEDYAKGRVYLSELARVTGGQMFRADSTVGGMSGAFEGIAEELSNQYVIGYYPQELGVAGQRKQIRIRVNRPNVAIRARDNYIVGEQAKAATK